LGRLDRFLTDLWTPRFLRGTRALVGAGRRFAERYHSEIPDERVVAFSRSAVTNAAIRLWTRPRSTDELVRDYLRVGERFARDTAHYLTRRVLGKKPPSLFFSYTTGALEVLQLLAEGGTPTIVDQIDPARTEDEIVHRETKLWPGWSTREDRVPEDYFERLAAEWKSASLVVVNSEWSRKSLIEQGVPCEKLRILPLAYDAPVAASPRTFTSPERTVLWVGQVVLRKGIQYLIGAARKLQKERLRFLIAGPVGISADALRSAPSNMLFIGPIPRGEVSALYRSADLFVFPTLSDGFGVTQLEAMAHGVPVIATRSCGDVVEHSVNGLIIPERDPDALAGAISELAFDVERLASMSAAAIDTANRFSIQVLSERLRVILEEEPVKPSKK
jgi:glycosyltransferase involved in cell wall biosynthesis